MATDMQRFVHLHVHSQFSLLDGQASIKGLVDKAIQDGMSGIALTDHGAMFGIKEFYNYVAKKNDPILSEVKSLKKEIQKLEEKAERTTEDEATLAKVSEMFVDVDLSDVKEETEERSNLKIYPKENVRIATDTPIVKVTIKIRKK